MSRSRLERKHRLGGEPIYCEADPSDALYRGSEDAHYSSASARKWAYEVAAVNFLNGNTRPLLSASLRGPFDNLSGWTNPWASKTTEVAPKRVAESPAASLVMVSRNKADDPLTTCCLPSPVSLDHKVYKAHEYLDEKDLARVEDWRSSIDCNQAQEDHIPPVQPQEKDRSAPVVHTVSNQKRRANTADWLKTTQNKRRRTHTTSHFDCMDQLSVITQDENTSPAVPTTGAQGTNDEFMDEDEIQADVQPQPACFQTPSRPSPCRRGLHHSRTRDCQAAESDDELSKPSESTEKPRFWKAASARSQVSRRGQATSPRSSPTRRFLRATTTTPSAARVAKTTDRTTADFETQQDNSFIFPARKKDVNKTLSAQQSGVLPSAVLAFDGNISDITSPGRKAPTAAQTSHIQVPDSPYRLPSAGEVVHGPCPATPEPAIIPTSQPLLDAKFSRATKKASSPETTADLADATNGSICEGSSVMEIGHADDPRDAEEMSTVSQIAKPQGAAGADVSTAAPTNDTAHDASLADVVPTVPFINESSPEPCAAIADGSKASTLQASHAASLDVTRSLLALCDAKQQVQLGQMEIDMVEVPAEEDAASQVSELSSVPSDLSMDGAPLSPQALRDATPPQDNATTESQQTPWQKNVTPTPSGRVTSFPRSDRLGGESQSSEPPAFSQTVEPIRNDSQQTPWHQDCGFSPLPQIPLSSKSSFLRSNESPLAQNSWIRSFEHMRKIAQRALFAAQCDQTASQRTSQPQIDAPPEEMPEESASMASGDTPSLHTAPITPRKEGPDTVFKDVSSPHDEQISVTLKESPISNGFVLKPFSAFRSSSPEPCIMRHRRVGFSSRPGAKVRGILTRRKSSDTSNRTRKHVSWGMLEGLSVGLVGDRHSRGTATTTRTRAPSPPPNQALADLPTGEKDPFRNHFSAVKKKAQGHRHRILPSASQQVWRSPSPTATAEAFIAADELPNAEGDVGQANQSPAADAILPEEGDESFDDVDEVLRNLGDFLDVVDVEADIEKAKADISLEKSPQETPLTAEVDVDVWSRF